MAVLDTHAIARSLTDAGIKSEHADAIVDAVRQAAGAPADLFTVHAETLAEAVAQHPPRGMVFKAGRLVARDGVYLG